jgi:hypothetical protein
LEIINQVKIKYKLIHHYLPGCRIDPLLRFMLPRAVDHLWVISLVVVVVVTEVCHPTEHMELMFVDFCGTCASDGAMLSSFI